MGALRVLDGEGTTPSLQCETTRRQPRRLDPPEGDEPPSRGWPFGLYPLPYLAPDPPATFDWSRRGVSALGYTEGRNVNFEYRWAEDALGQLPELSAELVRLKIYVFVSLSPPAAQAARNATQTIPIVFVAIGDP